MNRHISFAAGVIVGAVLFGGTAVIAAGFEADPSGQKFFLDGGPVTITAYNINGSNYVKLRDVAEAVDFGVTYDYAADSVNIQPDEPYTPEATPMPEPELTDYSLDAAPGIFTGGYLTRETYNAARQAYLDPAAEPLQVTGLDDEARSGLALMLSRMGGAQFAYNVSVSDGMTVITRAAIDRGACDEATNEVITRAEALPTDAEKVRLLNGYLCDRLVYDPKPEVWLNDVFTSPTPLEARCSTYAAAFKYLCWRAGVPCIDIRADNHIYSMVYADGRWLYVDVSVNDQTNTKDYRLLTAQAGKPDKYPDETAFIMEVISPGSVK